MLKKILKNSLLGLILAPALALSMEPEKEALVQPVQTFVVKTIDGEKSWQVPASLFAACRTLQDQLGDMGECYLSENISPKDFDTFLKFLSFVQDYSFFLDQKLFEREIIQTAKGTVNRLRPQDHKGKNKIETPDEHDREFIQRLARLFDLPLWPDAFIQSLECDYDAKLAQLRETFQKTELELKLLLPINQLICLWEVANQLACDVMNERCKKLLLPTLLARYQGSLKPGNTDLDLIPHDLEVGLVEDCRPILQYWLAHNLTLTRPEEVREIIPVGRGWFLPVGRGWFPADYGIRARDEQFHYGATFSQTQQPLFVNNCIVPINFEDLQENKITENRFLRTLDLRQFFILNHFRMKHTAAPSITAADLQLLERIESQELKKIVYDCCNYKGLMSKSSRFRRYLDQTPTSTKVFVGISLALAGYALYQCLQSKD